MAEQAIKITAFLLVALMFFSFHRAILGPTLADRVVAINVIGTKTVILVALLSFVTESVQFLDVSMVYALMSFVATCGIARYIEKGRVF